MAAMSGEYDHLRERLLSIAEEINEITMQQLRDAIEQGTNERPPDEKRLSKARRTIEKAAHLLDERPEF